jgi:hypothetical protein
VARDLEQVGNRIMDGDEALQMSLRLEAADSDEAAPLFRDYCAPGFRDDLAPCFSGGLQAVIVVSLFE